MGAPCWQHSFTCKRRGVLSYDVVPKLLVVLPFHFNLFWQSLNVTVPAPLFFSKCFRTNDELADDSSIAKTGFYIDLRLFCACASGTNDSNNETKFEHRWTNTFIRIFDLFVSPLIPIITCWEVFKSYNNLLGGFYRLHWTGAHVWRPSSYMWKTLKFFTVLTLRKKVRG